MMVGEIGNYDLLGMFGSTLVPGSAGLKYQMLHGASGGIGILTLNNGFQSPLLQQPTGAYEFSSIIIGMLSPLTGHASLFKGTFGSVVNEVITGGIQGGVDKGQTDLEQL